VSNPNALVVVTATGEHARRIEASGAGAPAHLAICNVATLDGVVDRANLPDAREPRSAWRPRQTRAVDCAVPADTDARCCEAG
jgi:hypothetical protein